MMMFWIFLVIDLVTVGIFYGVYGKKWKYEDGALMGVHIPQSAAQSEEVRAFMDRYHKCSGRFYFWNVAASMLICALNFWYVSVFMIAWSVWLVELCVGAMGLLCVAHRKLYDMKVEKGWGGCGGSRILAADTKNFCSVREDGSISVVASGMSGDCSPALSPAGGQAVYSGGGRRMDIPIFRRISQRPVLRSPDDLPTDSEQSVQ